MEMERTLEQSEKEIAIAKFCGWRREVTKTTTWWHRDGSPSIELYPPAYTTDLNAMHDAEKVLSSTLFAQDSDGQRTETNLYLTWLTRICEHSPIAFATAAQRADALLKIIAK